MRPGIWKDSLIVRNSMPSLFPTTQKLMADGFLRCAFFGADGLLALLGEVY